MPSTFPPEWQPVIIQTACLGDVILTTPLLRMASRAARTPSILVTRPGFASLFNDDPAVVTFQFDKHGSDRGPGGLWRAANRLRKQLAKRSLARPVGLLCQGSMRSSTFAMAAGIKRRICHSDAEGRWLATTPVQNDALRPWNELALLDGAPFSTYVSPRDAILWHLLPKSRDPRQSDRVALAIGSARETKRPPVPLLSELSQKLTKAGYIVVLIGSARERGLSQEISRRSGCAEIDATGCSLTEAAALLASCRLTVGGDSGLLHMARAVGTDTVVVYGPTSHQPFTKPASPLQGRHVSFVRDVTCRPCSQSGPRGCPLGHGRCMQLDPDDTERLWSLILRTINNGRSTPPLLRAQN